MNRLTILSITSLTLAITAFPQQQMDSRERQKSVAARSRVDPVISQASKAAMPVAANYSIRPGDVLQVKVWREADLSGDVPVQPDGKISMPLVNDIQAAGFAPLALSRVIADNLKKFVADPRVSVSVVTVGNRQIYVVGQVMRPGALLLVPQMTVLQALSSAGGLSQYTDGKKTYVLRTVDSGQQRLRFNYKQVIKGQRSEQNIFLEAGDTVVVP